MESASHIARNFHQHYAEGEPADIALQQSVKASLEDARTRPHQAFYWAPFFITSLRDHKTGRAEKWRPNNSRSTMKQNREPI